ncbi:hypothetical protein [Mucilaginibacter gilvus]|uniref:Uncharacterized protein n=1 Tax=Mucilaginibacter gilvus TaxID=2305909 RepID=A0A444MKF9_9SPHI|nr:hypothetical protein [Mucilaginibacter gilvus]RWY49314.1 hypothetical protein EPL05_18055 [Mucilaginibacter gilvus]
MTNDVTLWKKTDEVIIPKQTNNVSQIVNLGVQLSQKDQRQIIRSFEDGSYEMVATFIWTKAINSLRNQLSKMGISFIAEMLDRPDISEHTNVQQAISDFEAIRLAEELGVISGTAAFRLKQAMELVTHFNQPELEDSPENELSDDETKTIIRTCVQSILIYDKVEAAINFKNFRNELEELTLNEDSPIIIKLVQNPYFFQRTTIRILMLLVKTKLGAQLENALANANLIIPQLWPNLKHPERYQVGRTYSELFSDGKSKAANGLRGVLLKVKGFDFVPEDLRSSSFIKVANDILSAHNGMNNFYNEPAPVNTLLRMGSVIPSPAFQVCVTAVLCVRLGNSYGVSNAAQDGANAILKNITTDRWIYFFNECIQSNEILLYKLMQYRPTSIWLTVFASKFLGRISSELKNKDIINLVKFTNEKKIDRINNLADAMYQKLGYANS